MNTVTNASQTPAKPKSRWFFLLNICIAIVILSAVFLLKDSSSHYQSRSAFDAKYISVTKAETDPEILQHGIVHTEAARAHAYRSILKQSNGTFVIGLLVALAFIANSIFIYRITNTSHNQNMGGGAAA